MADEHGTAMYCPYCHEVRVCRGLSPSELGERAEQRMNDPDYPDIQSFRRGRECATCGKRFLTAEVNEQLIEELVDLRDEVSILKKNAARYVTELTAARSSLEQVSQSVSVLTAVGAYQNPSPYPAKPITELGLSVRARTAMDSIGIVTVGDLCRRTAKQLLRSHNFGETSLAEVRERLVPLGLQLRED